MIGGQSYPIYGQQIQTAYPQPYRPVYQPPQPMQTQMEPGMVNARYVTCKEEAVAAQIEKIHREETGPLHYNKECSQRLSYQDNSQKKHPPQVLHFHSMSNQIPTKVSICFRFLRLQMLCLQMKQKTTIQLQKILQKFFS